MSLDGRLTIDLGAIARNWRALDRMSAPSVETAAVVKADAYGLGADRVAPALADAGARTFFVALASEGAALRWILGPGPAIYVLGGYLDGDGALFDQADLRPCLNTAAQCAGWFDAAPGRPAAVQVDTGMNRLGMEAHEVPPLPGDGSVALFMSHLACADEPQHPQNAEQHAAFASLAAAHAPPGAVLSLSATGGTLMGEAWHHGMVRPGIGLYGGLPFAEAEPAVALTATVIQLRDVRPGESVGYGAAWRADAPSRVATISAGYADGLIRAAGNRAVCSVDGRTLPVIGRISMDLITLDATSVPDLAEGATVEILGPSRRIDAFAEAAGTIGYEVLTALGGRYQRAYSPA